MLHVLVLAQSLPTRLALEARLRLGNGWEAATFLDAIVFDPETLNVNGRHQLELFQALVGRVEDATAGRRSARGADQIMVLVDVIKAGDLKPLGPNNSWTSLIARLVLMFPEFLWVFGLIEDRDEVKAFPFAGHDLQGAASRSLWDPMFDGSGLREWIRGKAQDPSHSLPRRPRLALAIDDESSYGYFNAYAAYRFGFRSFVVDSERKLFECLHEGPSEDLAITFEDLFLAFPDGEQEIHWSDISERNRNLPALERSRVARVFVTTAHREGIPRDRQLRNEEMFEELRRVGRLGSVVCKPVAGIFDLRRRSLGRGGQSVAWWLGSESRAPGYVWPPARVREVGHQARSLHSAPGKLLAIANTLVGRAELLLSSGVHSIREAAFGAVLATDALELLGGRTPTTSLQALALKQRFEVLAECQFHGVGAHFDVDSRMKDIQGEIAALSPYFNRQTRQLSAWSAEAQILGALLAIFKECEQFDEELRLQGRNRYLHCRMWFKSQRWWGPLGDRLRFVNPAYWLVRYVQVLLGSVPRFVGFIVLWIGLLSVLHAVREQASRVAGGEVDGPFSHITEAIASFVGVNKPSPEMVPGDALYLFLTLLSVVWGAMHFGILVSHLYSVTSRR